MSEEITWMNEGGKPPEFVKDISEQMGSGEEGVLLVGGPSWVRTPLELGEELGGKKLYIDKQGFVDIRCPVCQAAGPVWIVKLKTPDQEKNLHVSCCSDCKQYGWFMK